MVNLKLALAGIFLVSISSLSAVAFEEPSLDQIPDSQAFVGWHEFQNSASDEISLDSMPRIRVSCSNKKLYATHPQQNLKTYHLNQWGEFSADRLTAQSQACVRGSKYKNGNGIFACFRPDQMERSVLSDTFVDSCGNYYRGVWQRVFLKTDENMGTLVSQGRTIYPGANGDYTDIIFGQTYPLSERDFLFLTPLFRGDREKIERMIVSARATHTYDEQTHLFTRKDAE